MKQIDHERIIAHHEDLILTSNCIVQKNQTWFGDLDYNEIPIDKIDSVSRKHTYKTIFLVLGLILLGFGIYNLLGGEVLFGNLWFFFILSALFFLLFYVTREKSLVIRSGNYEIVEEAKGAGPFIEKLRERMYRE